VIASRSLIQNQLARTRSRRRCELLLGRSSRIRIFFRGSLIDRFRTIANSFAAELTIQDTEIAPTYAELAASVDE
jgi:hypothetical protein